MTTIFTKENFIYFEIKNKMSKFLYIQITNLEMKILVQYKCVLPV